MISSGEIDESNVAAKVLKRSYPEKCLQCKFFPLYDSSKMWVSLISSPSYASWYRNNTVAIYNILDQRYPYHHLPTPKGPLAPFGMRIWKTLGTRLPPLFDFFVQHLKKSLTWFNLSRTATSLTEEWKSHGDKVVLHSIGTDHKHYQD